MIFYSFTMINETNYWYEYMITRVYSLRYNYLALFVILDGLTHFALFFYF